MKGWGRESEGRAASRSSPASARPPQPGSYPSRLRQVPRSTTEKTPPPETEMLLGPRFPFLPPHLSSSFFPRRSGLQPREGGGLERGGKRWQRKGERSPLLHAGPLPRPVPRRPQPQGCPWAPGRAAATSPVQLGARPLRGGGASPRRPLTCRGRGRWGCGGGPAASARVHASHLRHQLPQRRLNGSESQPPPPLPPPSLRCSRAAPARRPLALGRDQLLAEGGGTTQHRLEVYGSEAELQKTPDPRVRFYPSVTARWRETLVRGKKKWAKIARPQAAPPCGLQSGRARPAPAGSSACVYLCVYCM